MEKSIGRGSGLMSTELALTPRAAQILEYAAEEARLLEHAHVLIEHLWLGLLREEAGVAFQALENLDVNVGALRNQILVNAKLPGNRAAQN